MFRWALHTALYIETKCEFARLLKLYIAPQASSSLWLFTLKDLWSEKVKSVGRLWERFSGTGWEPGETALINNAAVSEGATQSPYAQTFLLTSKQKTRKVNRSGTPFQFIFMGYSFESKKVVCSSLGALLTISDWGQWG